MQRFTHEPTIVEALGGRRRLPLALIALGEGSWLATEGENV